MKEKLDAIFSHYSGKRYALIPVLQEVQQEFGYLPPEAMDAVGKFCHVSPVEVYGVATFYAQFKLKPVGKNIITICKGTACHVMGGAQVLEEVKRRLGVSPGDTTDDGMFTLETVACIGACALAPAVVINKDTHGRMRSEKIMEVLNAAVRGN